jgi:XTP/dITP diphosphohydrolase
LIGTFLFATRSEDKVRELRPIMRALGYDVQSLREAGIPVSADEDGIEVFDTFEANALAKARYFSRVSGGTPVLADDSGLEVDKLHAQPGVRSKRWSGRYDLSGQALDDANNEFLLATLAKLGHAGELRARYVCAAACVWAAGQHVTVGTTAGAILTTPQGTAGFGYDPYFLSDELGQTFGDVAEADKSRISHRGRAFRALAEDLGRIEEFPSSDG